MQRTLPNLRMALLLLVLAMAHTACSQALARPWHWTLGILPVLYPLLSEATSLQTAKSFETSNNGTNFVWIIQDTYNGQNFFDRFQFFTGGDPTHGMVNYTDASTAFADGLAYVSGDGKVIMKGDNTTTLASGVYRNSVRVSSETQYNTGLFILDVDQAPWGCGVWPAWWTLGGGMWPYTGEIDIIEGVHDNSHNQVTWHTGNDCLFDLDANYTGTLVSTNGQPNTNCSAFANGNSGCGVTEWSRASYGPTFDAQGGGVFAMKWDEDGIAVWSFYRAAVPQDVVDGEPTPSTWGTPVAMLLPTECDPIANFVNHSIVFDITFCGDWAGNSYATSGCPGTCSDHLMDPANFVNASWSIRSLKVYKKQTLNGVVNAGVKLTSSAIVSWLHYLLVAVIAAACFAL